HASYDPVIQLISTYHSYLYSTLHTSCSYQQLLPLMVTQSDTFCCISNAFPSQRIDNACNDDSALLLLPLQSQTVRYAKEVADELPVEKTTLACLNDSPNLHIEAMHSHSHEMAHQT
ncbi:hypothetical protein V8G54_016945, partial [Vigna mungo]